MLCYRSGGFTFALRQLGARQFDGGWRCLTCGSGAGGDNGLLNATTSPTKTLPTDGRGIHRISSFSTAADAAVVPGPLPLLLSLPLPLIGAAARVFKVGACGGAWTTENHAYKVI